MADAKSPKLTPTRQNKHCTQANCKRPYRAKGLCNMHYSKWRDGELPKGRYKICTKEGCRKPRALGSICAEHAAGTAAS
ncbi:MAG: vegetative protein [Myxococcales bacterium]|nr:vegetative protein [Myxococcales bacterium]